MIFPMVSWNLWRHCVCWTISEVLHHIISKEITLCFSMITLPCFNPSPCLVFLLFTFNLLPSPFSLSLIYSPVSIHPSVYLVFSVPAAESLQDHQSFFSVHTRPSFSVYTNTHTRVQIHSQWTHVAQSYARMHTSGRLRGNLILQSTLE